MTDSLDSYVPPHPPDPEQERHEEQLEALRSIQSGINAIVDRLASAQEPRGGSPGPSADLDTLERVSGRLVAVMGQSDDQARDANPSQQ